MTYGCAYCLKEVGGVFQVYPPPAKPCCGKAECLKKAKADSEVHSECHVAH